MSLLRSSSLSYYDIVTNNQNDPNDQNFLAIKTIPVMLEPLPGVLHPDVPTAVALHPDVQCGVMCFQFISTLPGV